MKQVTRQVFFAFLDQYSGILEREECEVIGLVAFSDFSLGGYPVSIVAKYQKIKDQSQIKYFLKE